MGTGIRQGWSDSSLFKYLEDLSMVTGFHRSPLQPYHVIDPLVFE